MMRPRRAFLLALCVVAALWLCALVAQAAEAPQRLLERMNRALEQVEFNGTLVYLHGQDLAALRVTHRIKDGNPGESMLSLTGPVRALSRHARGVTCMLPDAAPLTVPKAHGRRGMLRKVPLDFERLSAYYDIRYLGQFRVAGRDTDVVGVLAQDGFRYGYRFYLDKASGLPLKLDLLDEDETPVQQIMFTDIAIEGQGDAGAEPAGGGSPEQVPAQADAGPNWLSAALPPGFHVVSEESLRRDDGASIHQLVLSDGLASFSIYLEPPLDGALQGESRLGAVSAAGGRVGEQQVTVVGEVPPATVRMVLEGTDPPDQPW
ncbi:MAG: MucB/RseB C-terminal domain-containing protein [Thiohalocapsa sp.]|jgi:sigma-E factor negative regulatory protein RseB|uniref:MucB/RseB C-terminal domain-containing protein n=1 Tax=Thiohalocapsa sp. TaxID=2497641 RepID=UPI0025ED4067|nr:MucB/RseB C-terminal domain-containing protein [Thiohalocapsa sp.]MCG6939778.1 MucB/RseB C-terminal domain-containing protein [Thiohalocapsa sp.]